MLVAQNNQVEGGIKAAVEKGGMAKKYRICMSLEKLE